MDNLLNNSDLFVYNYVFKSCGLLNYKIINDLYFIKNIINEDNIVISNWSSSITYSYLENQEIKTYIYNQKRINLLDKKYEDGDIKKYDEIAKNIKNIEGADEKIKEKPELLFALGDNAKPEDKAKTQEYVKQTKNILDHIDVEHISDEKFYDKLKAEFDKTENGILAWCKNNEKRLELYTNKELPNDIKNDIIPKLWNAKSFLTTVSNELNDSYNPFYDYDLIILLEADENEQGKNTEGLEDRVKKGCEAINTLFATNKESEFISKYKECIKYI